MDTSLGRTPPAAGGRSWVPLLAVGLGYFMVILDATAVNLALPALSRDLGGGVTGLQWILDGYTLAFAALLLSAGVAGDRFGPRRVFLTGLAIFTAASAGCALAPGIGALIAIRLIQGSAAALLVPASLSLLQASYPDRAARARAVGLWGGIGGLAAASGPVLGGALTTAGSWRLVFAINIPVGLLAIWITRRRVASPAAARDRGADPLGQIVAIVALTALTASLIEAGPHGWASWPVLGGLALAAVASAGFVGAQHRAASPMLPLTLLRRPALSAGTAVGLLINLGVYGQLFAFSLYLQQIRGDSPLTAGLALLPEAAAVPVASVLSGRLTGRRGPRVTMITGLSLGAAGLLGLVIAGRGTPYGLLVLPLLAAGSGMALTMPATTSAVLEAAPRNRSGAASGLVNTARQAGSAIGVAVAGSLLNGRSGFMPGLHLALATSGAAFGAGVVITLAGVGRPAKDQPAAGQPEADRIRADATPAVKCGH
ncbi:MAG TPA: MFS transporter [Streptosporangiaceae bacterium]|nr:MFS transporter [Streptosporangiaceae bacterium]